MKPRLFTLLFLLFISSICFAQNGANQDLILKGTVNIYTDAKAGDPVFLAINSLKKDLHKTLGADAVVKPLSAIGAPGIIILNNTQNNTLGTTISGVESHHLYIHQFDKNNHLVLEGADTRGTIYAIYTFSEKILGVPPLWYFTAWQPTKRNEISIRADFDFKASSPTVKYRAWFPNDTDLFSPWRKLSEDNYELWLECALRLKLNTIEWFDSERDYAKPFSVSKTTALIRDYGLINTTHHHSPLNSSFAGWNDYWSKTRHMKAPKLLLANMDKLEEFWKYNIESIVKNKIDMLWVLGFRGDGDHPFWYTFTDAPTDMAERGKIISDVIERQRKLVLEITGNPKSQFRTIFYDELSDLLAKGLITTPADTTFIRTYVAARRDHFPNADIQNLDKSKNFNLGYYFNYQFTSTGSHLAAAEGPWKMEQNLRYIATKTNKPLAFSVVNAGNLREHLMELAANAAMMWDFSNYDTDKFLSDFCTTYFGKKYSKKAASLYVDFYNAYWQQRKPDFAGIDRQYVFQDLRYNRAIKDLADAFNQPFQDNPLKEISAEQVPNRTYNIVPSDNGTKTVIDAIIDGTTKSAAKFRRVAVAADKLTASLENSKQQFFKDNLCQQAWYMYHLNCALLHLSQGYKEKEPTQRKALAQKATDELHLAADALHVTQHGIFSKWYANERVFGFENVYNKLENLLKK